MTVTINGTSGLSGAIVGKIDGSQTAPTLQGTDTNTGVFFPVADAIAFSTNGVESARMIANGNIGFASKTAPYTVSANGQLHSTRGAYFATSSGSVGIGTSSPATRLDVRANNPTRGILELVRNDGASAQTGSQIQISQNAIEDWAIGQPAGVSAFAIWSGRNTAADGTERMRIDSSGRVTKPYQPAFFARGTAGDVTTTNLYDFVFDSAAFNIGGHYNTSNGRFTAPIAGVYAFQYNLFNNGGTGRISLKYNGASYQNHQMNCGALSTPITQAITMYLNAGDYVTVGDWQSISGKVIYIGHSYFCGHLVS